MTTLELAKRIGQEPTNVRRKAAALNGIVNFDREEDAFSEEQLRVFLPTYLTGQRQLKGKKRQAVEALLKSLGGAIESKIEPPVKAPSKPIEKSSQKPIKEERSPSIENQLKQSFLTRRNFLLGVVIGLVLVQASHFTLYYVERIGGDGLTDWLTTLYGVLIGILAEAMGLILVANERGKKWLAIFAIISFAVNCLFYRVFEEGGFDLAGEMLLAGVIPLSIYLSSELYIDKK